MGNGEPAAMEELRRRYRAGSEIVCVIRDPNNPQAKTEVITLRGGTPAVASQPSSGGRPQNIPTSMEVPARSTPILEWDAESGWKHQAALP